MKLYRYEISQTHAGIELDLETFKVIKETPKGYWIKPDSLISWPGEDNWAGSDWGKRWMKKDASRVYACKTEELALSEFIGRKKRQVHILKEQLRIVTAGIEFAESKEFYNKELAENRQVKISEEDSSW